MKTTIYSLVIALMSLLFIRSLKAQVAVKPLCGDEWIKNDLEKRLPGFKQAVEETFNQTKEMANQSARSNTPYFINVVVHVVYKNPEENLPDSVIQSQIDVLNEDYNRLNPDTANLRALFKPIAGNANIHFNLAQIIRKQTTVNFSISLLGSGMPNQMKWDSLGGSSAVDPDHYLNIWVVKIQPIMLGSIQIGQVLGFAFPPAGLSNWPANSAAPVKGEDGVVIDFRCFGRNNPNPISVDGTTNLDIRGRTPSHEVGHYLGLRHIWGDGGVLGGGNNCTGSDGIDDTPKADNQSNFDCNTTKNTCVDTLPWTSIDAPDLIENFMDYSAETCMNMFTAGQVAHMRATLEGPRNGLISLSSVNSLNNFNHSVSVYPNPTSNKLTISTLNNNIVQVEIYDIYGQRVLKQNTPFNLTNITINTENLEAGTYLAKITTNESKTIVKKVLIVK